jgi:haloalkane dehalogenase
MAYVEEGEGAPIVLLHGNPTSSYLWRSVIPELSSLGRCIAPDLIGMGDSDKLPASDPNRYTFKNHRVYLDGFLETLGLDEGLVLVVHDWGSALGFDWVRRHPGKVRGIAYMEAITRPFESWEELPEGARPGLEALRSPAGEQMALEENISIEGILPGLTMRELSAEEMDEYRRPYPAPDDRLPTLLWPREIPIAGEPADVHAVCAEYAEWLARTPGLPKLFVNADPGAVLVGGLREFCRTWPDQTEVTVPGIHFIQEDSGAEIGRAIAAWLPTLGAAR